MLKQRRGSIARGEPFAREPQAGRARSRLELERRRAPYRALRALARLEELEAYIGSHTAELARPRDFIAAFVGQYIQGEPGTIAPEALELELAELEIAGRILIDARRDGYATFDGLLSWCLRDLPAADRFELCTAPSQRYLHGCPAPVVAVAHGDDPAAALAERRKWASIEADFARLTGRAIEVHWKEAHALKTPELTFGTPEWVAAFRDLEQRRAAPARSVDAADPQLVVLTALRDVIFRDFAGRDRVAPMARWAFREHPRRDSIAGGLARVAGTLQYFADLAGIAVSKLSADLRSAFLIGTRLAETEPSELVGMGLGEVAELDRYFPGAPAAELVDVALGGQIDELVVAVEVAGLDAREWVWVKRIEEALIFAAQDRRRSAKDRAEARTRLGYIAVALSKVGSGRVVDEATVRDAQRDAEFARKYIDDVRAHLKARRRDPATPLAARLRRAGFVPEMFAKKLEAGAYEVIARRLGTSFSRIKQLLRGQRK